MEPDAPSADNRPSNFAGDAASTETPDGEALPTYRCPGEAYTISRSVHFARLAAHYPLCRNCPSRDDQGALPISFPTAPLLENSEEELITETGVRAVYLNVLHRTRAVQWGRAIGKTLIDQRRVWEESRDDADSTRKNPIDHSPHVVLGHDERVSSPEIAAGLVRGLRQQGIDVADLGFCRKPDLVDAMSQRQAATALFVTGSGYGPAWTGFDLLGPGGLFWDHEGDHHASMAALRRQMATGEYAHAVVLGTYTPIRIAEQDLSLREEFHALRPLTIVCAAENDLLVNRLSRLLEHRPCRLVHLTLHSAHRDLSQSETASLGELQEAVRKEQAHLGCYFAADGETFAAIDERGAWLGWKELTLLLASELCEGEPGHADRPEPALCLTTSAHAAWKVDLERCGFRCLDGGPSPATLMRTLAVEQGVLGAGGFPRWWLRVREFAVCDSLRIFGTLLRALSRTDQPCSVRVKSLLENRG